MGTSTTTMIATPGRRAPLALDAHAVSATHEVKASRAAHRYELLGEIATGGMATVFLARLHRPLGFSRLVAIKCMHPQYAKDPEFAAMFVDEARLTARLRHPNVVPTVDIVANGGELLLVMEYVEGDSLSGLLRAVRASDERIPVPIACAIVHDVLLGLHEAHDAKDDDGSPLAIVHRDVSPQNVLVGTDGLARLLDFGVAKARRKVHHTADGEIKGKIPYMAPEQLFGEAIDRKADVWAAGVLLWEALVGTRLFDGGTDSALVQRISSGEIEPPSARTEGVPPELDAVVLAALAQDPSARFATALTMAERLSSAVALPPRTEVSAWMKRFAPRRDLSAFAVRSSGEGALAALLAGASEPGMLAGATASSRKKKPSRRLAVALVAGLMVASACAIGVARAASAASTSPPAREGAVAETTAASLASVPVVTVAPRATADEPVQLAVPGPRPAKAASPVRPRKAAAAPAAVEPAAAAEAHEVLGTSAKQASCRPPYIVDAQGHRHYKVECL
jgi:eukaryotic-like serine/threonine-protein kinase